MAWIMPIGVRSNNQGLRKRTTKKTKRREDMSKIKHKAESAEHPSRIGRIAPLNMPAETNRLNSDSLILDMTTANNYDCGDECLECQFWA